MNKQYLLGVDGGNTKTDYILFDVNGQFVDGLRSGTCSHEALSDSFAGSKRVMGENISTLLKRNNITITDIKGAAFGLAGVDVPTQKVSLHQVIEELGFTNFVVENDGFLGIKAASNTGYGVCSINGTGTVTVGIDNFGNHVQVGGVGYISGDEAGGAFLVRRTLQAVYDELYRMGPATTMTKEIFDLFGVTQKDTYLSTIVNLLEQRKIDRTTIIKMLFKNANASDQVAMAVLEQAGKCMGQSVAGCIDNLKFNVSVPVILAGSVWANATATHMFDSFKKTIESNRPEKIEYIVLKVAPACGAIVWALEIATGSVPSDSMRQHILKQVEEYQNRQ